MLTKNVSTFGGAQNPVEKLPTVVVIPIPAHTAEISNFFVSLTIAGRNMATPTLDTTEIKDW